MDANLRYGTAGRVELISYIDKLERIVAALERANRDAAATIKLMEQAAAHDRDVTTRRLKQHGFRPRRPSPSLSPERLEK